VFSVEQLTGFLTQPLKDAELSLYDGAFRQAQLFRDFRGWPAIKGQTSERFPGNCLEVPFDHSRQLLEYVLVVFPVPLPSDVAGGVRQLREKNVVFAAEQGQLLPHPLKSPNAIQSDSTQPHAKRSVTAPLESRQFADEDNEDFLGQIVRLVAHAGNAAKPILDKR